MSPPRCACICTGSHQLLPHTANVTRNRPQHANVGPARYKGGHLGAKVHQARYDRGRLGALVHQARYKGGHLGARTHDTST
eukprot:349898-Chlamydomonas_euryale.AAC.11